MSKLRLALYPLAIVYDGITRIKNFLYNKDILPSKSFDIPLIVVGNLSVGGTGKTPHTEYIAKLLKKTYKVGVLSRGYGRKSQGFVLADKNSTSQEIGDEPKQIKTNIPDITVAVCEDRATGVQKLLSDIPLETIILDDAFQHRKIKGSLYILLTTYSELYSNDFVLPAGNLRESSINKNRADIIIITKCPTDLSESQKKETLKTIHSLPHQKVYFSTISYITPIGINTSREWGNNSPILLVTGIVNPTPLKTHLEKSGNKVQLMSFADHHEYSKSDVNEIQNQMEAIGKDTILVTTSKDAVKLKPLLSFTDNSIDAFEVPIEIEFLFNTETDFQKIITANVSEISRSS